jgi:hypothetical protein
LPASSSASARPMPLDAPVMTATRSANGMTDSVTVGRRLGSV